MQNVPCFKLQASWPSRKESVASATSRLHAFFRLSEAPPNRSWHCVVPPDGYRDLQADPGYIERHIEMQMEQAVKRGRLPGTGFLDLLSAMCADQVPRADDPFITLHAGSAHINCFQLFTDNEGTTDPRFVTYDVMRRNMLSSAVAFEPDWCEAGPADLYRYLDEEPYVRPPIGLAWMTWLSPAYAKVITPPARYQGTITEHLSDGSLFMATSTKTFDMSRLEDLRMARAIHRQVDVINYTVPFNGQCGRSDRVPPFPKV